ncbi:MAG: hypothetical protein COB17_08120 [Sulfurimonas sp.]|nr:MAG: hypothetical protein COB17_08120 [Sulfurimonas sp.]
MKDFDDEDEIAQIDQPIGDDDDEELDIIKLVSTNANDTSQYLVFVGSDDQYYAKNVSKIKELLVYKDINIAKNHGGGLIIGTADIRGNMTTIINFDSWFGNDVLDDSEYELIILAHYGGHRIGIVVKRVEYIINIPSDTMTDNSGNNEKTSFISRIQVAGKEELCMIFDSDKMLLDVFDIIDDESREQILKLDTVVDTNKIVLLADDSRFIRQMIADLLHKMELGFNVYENGQLLLDDLENIQTDDIGLIITDLEMPVLGGRELVSLIRKEQKYDKINIIVHTNMSDENMKDTLLEVGANEIIGKVNMANLSKSISKLIR